MSESWVSISKWCHRISPRWPIVKTKRSTLKPSWRITKKIETSAIGWFHLGTSFRFWLVGKRKMYRDLSRALDFPTSGAAQVDPVSWVSPIFYFGKDDCDPGYESWTRNEQNVRDTQTRWVRDRGAQIDRHSRVTYKREGLLIKSVMVWPAVILFLWHDCCKLASVK